MSELASPATDYAVVEREPPELLGRNLRVASHLWSSATIFFFIAFLFAYFYLRSLNNQHLWHPHAVKAPVTLGTLIAVALALSGVAAYAAARRLAGDDQRGFRSLGVGAFLLGLVAVVLQIVAWTQLGFGPTDGGFASVYIGWTGLYLIFLVGSLFWLETLLATSFRYREAAPAPGEASGDAERTGDDIARPVSVVGPGADSFAFYWSVLAGVGVVSWVILYLI